MARSLRLTPTQREILWTLEEAGSEEFPTLLNTLQAKPPRDAPLEPMALIASAEAALRGLWRLGLVVPTRDAGRGAERFAPVPQAEASSALALSEFLRWNDAVGQWEWQEAEDDPHRLSLALTESGERALRT